MTDKSTSSQSEPRQSVSEQPKQLSSAAKRALSEAEQRRKQALAAEQKSEQEVGGRGGQDPARFGDWEINGRAIDF